MPKLSSLVARRNQTVVATIATIGGFLFGYDTGVISSALLYIADDLHLTVSEQSLVVSCLLIGAAFGGSFGGRLSDTLGRRRLIWLAAILFVLGTVGSAVAPNMEIMIAARVVLGLAVGAVSAVVPLYIGEIAPTTRRGRLVNQNELLVVAGQLSASVVNAIVANVLAGTGIWRVMLGIALVPAIALFAGSYFLPESPRFLVRNHRFDEAEEVLHRLRIPEDADTEYRRIRHAHDERQDQREVRPTRILAFRWVRVLVLVGIGLSLCNQLAGINAVVYYAPALLTSTGVAANAAVLGNIAIGVMGLIAVSVGMYLVGRVDRRPMLMAGQAGAVACHLGIALLFIFLVGASLSFAVLGVIVVFIFFNQCFIATVTWLALSELFPMQVRGFAMGIAVFFQWAANFAISELFPNVASGYGPPIAFGGFAFLSVLGLLFTKFVLPETRNEPLEDLERRFKARYSPSRD